MGIRLNSKKFWLSMKTILEIILRKFISTTKSHNHRLSQSPDFTLYDPNSVILGMDQLDLGSAIISGSLFSLAGTRL